MSFTPIASLVALLASLLTSATPGTTFTHVTAENGVSHYDMTADEGNGTYTEPGSPYVFNTGWKQGERTSMHPVEVATITPTTAEHYRGREALAFQIDDHQEPGTAAYRTCLNLQAPKDPFIGGVVHPNDRYLGFAVKIDPAYYVLPQRRGQDVIIAQWHQASPEHPVVTLSIVTPADATALGWPASPTGHFALVIRNDTHNAMETTPGAPLQYDLGPVATGTWTKWVMHVRAGLRTNGAVTVWKDDRRVADVTDQRVGFDPANPQYPKPPFGAFDYVGICIYREHGLNHQRLFFDEAKFADTYAAATP